MAENIGNFQEVLSIQVPVEEFVQSLEKLKNAYSNFISSLDAQTKEGLGSGLTASLGKSLDSLNKNLKEFSKDIVGSIAQLETQLTAVFEKLDTKTEASVDNAKRKLAELKNVQDNISGITEGKPSPGKFNLETIPKFARGIRTEQEGVVNEAEIKRLRDEAEQLIQQQKEIDEAFKQRSKDLAELQKQELQREKELQKVNQERLKVEEEESKRQKEAEDQFYRERSQINSTFNEKASQNAKQRAKDEEDSIKQVGKAQKEIDDKVSKDLAESQKLRNAAFKNSEKSNAEAQAESLAAAKTQSKEFFAEQQRLEQARQSALQRRLEIEEQLTELARKRAQLEANTRFAQTSGNTEESLRARIQLLNQAISQHRTNIENLRNKIFNLPQELGLTQGAVNLSKNLNEEIEGLNKRLTQLASVSESNKKAAEGFFSHMLHGFKNTISLVIRFYTVFALLQAAIDAIKFTIGAPFEILADGLTYMRGLEESATDLQGVLAANVIFSKDLSENFKIARNTSVDLVELLKQRAIATGTPFDNLNATFKALLQGGAFKTVSTLQELVKLAELFQLSLTAAGAGGLAAQGSIQEISKLFTDMPNRYNKFLAALKVSPAEWVKLRTEAEKHRNLLDILPKSMLNYVDAVALAQINQERLAKTFKELIDRIGAEGGRDLFNFITVSLQKAIKFLEDNFNALTAFVQTLSLSIKFLGEELSSAFSQNRDGISTWFRIFLSINDIVLRLISSLELVGGLLGDVGSSIKARLTGNAKEFTESISNMGNRFKDFANDAQKISNITQQAINTFNSENITEAGSLQATKDLEILRQNRKILVEEMTKKPNGKFTPQQYTEQLEKLDLLISETSAKIKKSNLNTLFGAVDPAPNPKEVSSSKLIANLLSNLDVFRQKYLNDVEDIQEASRNMRNSIQEDLSAHTISQREATDSISESIADEIGSLDTLRDAFRLKFLEAIEKIRQVADSPEALAAGQQRVVRQLEAFERQEKKRRQALLNEQFKANKQLAKDDLDLDKATIESRFKLREEELRNLSDLYTIARESGLVTEKEYFDKVASLQKEFFDLEVDRLNDRIKREAAGSSERKKLEQELDLVKSKFSNNEEERARKRELILQQEAKTIREFVLALRQAEIQGSQNISNLIKELRPESGFSSAIQESINLRAKELDLLEQELKIQLEIAAAKNAESEETRRLIVSLTQLRTERDNLFSVRAQELLRGSSGLGSTRAILQQFGSEEVNRRRLAVSEANARLNAFDAANPIGANIITNAKVLAERSVLELELKLTAEAFEEFRVNVFEKEIKSSFKLFGKKLLDAFVGPGVVKKYQEAQDKQTKAAAVADALANGLQAAVNAVSTFKKGREEGGILGGVGATISSFRDALSVIPVVGKFLPAIGSILSVVGSLFTASAKRIAEDVKRNFQNTIDNYQNGNENLVNTLRILEEQRLSAISRLSSTKGGKKELEKILPEFDNQISQLRAAQKKILTDFEDSLEVLRDSSGVLSDIKKKWLDINNQVKEYIGAGGDVAKAQEFLSLNLSRIRADAAAQLEQAEQDAIQEAIKFNDLLKERENIIKDFAKKEFDVITKNAIERRKSNVIVAGEELEALRKQKDEQLANIDREISLETKKLERQKEVFDLSKDVAALRRRDEELTLKALDLQIQRLKDLRELANSITLGPNGLNTSSLLQPSQVTMTVNITGLPANQAGSEIADALSSELERRYRMVPSLG